MLIDTQDQLEQMCLQLRNYKSIALDIEFMRRTTFYSIVSLIQIATEVQAYVVDITQLTSEDLQPLYDIILDDSIVKIMHSATQDLDILYQCMGGAMPYNIFDTQIAMMTS